MWLTYERSLLAAWTEEHPGSRPSYWWRLSAPGAPDAHRAILGGSGRRAACTPVCGVPIMTRVNVIAPPIIEAEAEFLRRHGLLLRNEPRRLRPESFEPVEIGEPELAA
jgi:hypothetical protein